MVDDVKYLRASWYFMQKDEYTRINLKRSTALGLNIITLWSQN
jgi:hypothetical protein